MIKKFRAKIGIIGCGNMGSAIASQIKVKFPVFVFDKDKNKTKGIAGVFVAKGNLDLVSKVDVVILAIKPQDFDDLLKQIRGYANDKLIISIAAGISTGYIQKRLGRVKVVRVMPNLPAKIGEGVSCLSKGKFATKKDLNLAKVIFDELGQTLIIHEDMMNKATAISGSGPGFLCDIIYHKNIDDIDEYSKNTFIPSLIKSSTNLGFSQLQAEKLAIGTTKGTVALLKVSEISPEDLEKQVASKGGTTEAGLEILHKGGTLDEAIKAALKRAKELSRRD